MMMVFLKICPDPGKELFREKVLNSLDLCLPCPPKDPRNNKLSGYASFLTPFIPCIYYSGMKMWLGFIFHLRFLVFGPSHLYIMMTESFLN